MKTLIYTFLFTFVVVLAAFVGPTKIGQPACATTLVDDTFDGTVLNRCKWDESSQSGGQFTVNDQLIATTSSASAFSIPRITRQYRLTGDFDFQACHPGSRLVRKLVDDQVDPSYSGRARFAGMG